MLSIYLFIDLFIYFQRRYMHALVTEIAIQMQNVKVENASVKERELETGKTAEVRAVGYQHGCNWRENIWKLVALTWYIVFYAVIIFSSLVTFER